jgi:NAD(P)-dependent dehydrogenase (short-subunit alcohol dehydrogenase family)
MRAEGTALVTGASRGLGRAISLELASRGFSVLATMRDPRAGEGLEAEAAERGGSLEVARLDVTHASGFSMPRDLQVIVCNAGVRGPYLPVETDPIEHWRDVFETNVFGTFTLLQRAIPVLRERGAGVICTVTSSSLLKPMPFFGPYRASKAAVSALGSTLRAELEPHGIRVLKIMPGPIDTDLLRDSVMVRPPDAIELEAYRPLALRAFPPAGGGEHPITAPQQAAVAVAEAILDDDAPLRVGCDPSSISAIALWRSRDDEAHQRDALASWALEVRR